jgi:uncharacterized protein with NRDE domain
MCLAVVALDAHPRYALVVAANRDEYHARPAAPVDWWKNVPDEGLLAGRDLEAGGTWLGVTRRGRWAFVTNVREPGRHDASAPSRGALVPRFLRNNGPVEAALVDVLADAARYNGFNLLGGDLALAAWGSNRVAGVHPLSAGVHGVSNARLDTPWPKLERTKAGMSAWAANGNDDISSLFDLLADRARPPDAMLPSTGVSLDYERLLSSPFIVSPRYGTRCSTVLTIARTGAAHLIERAFDADGAPAGHVEHRFAINEAGGP